MNKTLDHFIWNEKFRPNTIDDCILPQHAKDSFQKFKEQGDFPHLMLTGGPGVGKCHAGSEVFRVWVNDTLLAQIHSGSLLQPPERDQGLNCILISVGDLYAACFYCPRAHYQSRIGIAQYFNSTDEIYVKDPNGKLIPVVAMVMKKDKKLHTTLKNGINLYTSPNHLVVNERGEVVPIAQANWLMRQEGAEYITRKKLSNREFFLYDICVDTYDHLYVASDNGVIHHNTTVGRALGHDLDMESLFCNASEEGGIDVLRTTIRDFCSNVSFFSRKKLVILDECLDENEEIIIGYGGKYQIKKLKDFKSSGKFFALPSVDMKTRQLEDCWGFMRVSREAELFKVLLEDGRSLRVTDNHPFIVVDESGELVQKRILDGLGLGDRVLCVDDVIENRQSYQHVSGIDYVGLGTVKNLTVLGTHTFISKNGIVTHNCDNATQSFQTAFRGFMEEFSKSVRFILTANYENRIIEPIHSRTSIINFTIPKDEKPRIMQQMMQRIQLILTEEKIPVDSPKTLALLVSKHFPDMRRIVNELQRYSSKGRVDLGILEQVSDKVYHELVGLLKKKQYSSMLAWVSQHVSESPDHLFRKFYDSMYQWAEPASIPELVLILAKYQYQSAFSADREILLAAALTEIMAEVKFKNE